MTEVYTCGYQLKTTTCKRAPLWPGGRCERHGYGAETLGQWIAVAPASSVKLYFRFDVTGYNREPVDGQEDDVWQCGADYATEGPIVLSWVAHKVTRKAGRRGGAVRLADGEMSIEDAAVIADHLMAHGIGDDDVLDRLRTEIRRGFRAKARLAGVDAHVEAAATRLRAIGVHAIAVDDMIVVPQGSIDDLLARLGA